MKTPKIFNISFLLLILGCNSGPIFDINDDGDIPIENIEKEIRDMCADTLPFRLIPYVMLSDVIDCPEVSAILIKHTLPLALLKFSLPKVIV